MGCPNSCCQRSQMTRPAFLDQAGVETYRPPSVEDYLYGARGEIGGQPPVSSSSAVSRNDGGLAYALPVVLRKQRTTAILARQPSPLRRQQYGGYLGRFPVAEPGAGPKQPPGRTCDSAGCRSLWRCRRPAGTQRIVGKTQGAKPSRTTPPRQFDAQDQTFAVRGGNSEGRSVD